MDKTFDIGDIVSIINPNGDEVAKGVTLYSSAEIRKIMGLHTDKIAGVLGYTNGNTVIHRNDMVHTEIIT